MATFFIIDQDTFDNSDWVAAPYWKIVPGKLEGGEYEGKYAVKTTLLDHDSIFEKYRTTLEAFPTATDEDLEDHIPPPPEE